MAVEGEVSVVDSTVRLMWEVTKEDFDNCEFKEGIVSPKYNVLAGDRQSKWRIKLYPMGENEEDKDEVKINLNLSSKSSKNKSYNVRFQFAVKTPTGYWPNDFVETLYCRNESQSDDDLVVENTIFGEKQYCWGYQFCSTKKFSEMFIQDKITVVATMAVFIEGKSHLKHKNMAEEFMRDMRTMPELDMFYDLTVICGGKRFKSNKVLLASRSWVFRRMLETDMTEKIKGEINIEDVKPDIIKDILDYLSSGLIPDDFDTKAVEMIHVAEKYKLEALIEACENSLVDNLSVDNVINSLITVDLYVPKSGHRQKILDFINSKAPEVIKTKDWINFVQKYPKLVTELYLAAAAGLVK